MSAWDSAGAAGFMQGAAKSLAGMQQQQFGLRQAVDSGQLSINPEAAANAAKACRDLRERIQLQLSKVSQHAYQSGYGSCAEGEALQTKMAGKWQEAYDLLGKEQEILENMAQTYEAAGRAYQQAEDANRHALGGLR